MSKLADYGTVILTTMLLQPDRIQSAAEIAAGIRVPLPTVSKILKILTREGLVVSLRGSRGGYVLARAADQISMAQVIEAMDGPIGMTECSISPGLCVHEQSCPVRANWNRVNQIILQALRGVTLDQMVEPAAASAAMGEVSVRRPLPHHMNGEQA